MVKHPWSRWWQFIPLAPTVLGYRRTTIDIDLLEQDARRTETFFGEHGWRQASVQLSLIRPRMWLARITRSRKRDRTLEAHFQVDVGQRSFIDDIMLYGDPVAVSLPEGRFGKGAPWGLATERAFRKRLQRAAETGGHGLAEVELTQQTGPDGATGLEVTIDRGPRVTFGPLTFAGNDNLADVALRRAAGRSVAEGVRWSPRRVERLERRLRRMPGVAHARVERVTTAGDGTVPLRVSIEEADRDEVVPENELLGRTGTLTGIVGATWIRRHVFRRNNTTRLTAAAGYRHIWRDVWAGDSGPAARFGFGFDSSLEPSATMFLHTSVDAELDQWHGYHYVRGDAEVGPRFQRGAFSLWAGYRLTQFIAFPFPLQRPTFDRFFERGDQANAPVERSYRLHQSALRLRFDTIDDPVNPKRGVNLELDVLPVARVEGATVARLAGDLDTYWPTPHHILTLRLRVGGGLLGVRQSSRSDVGVLLGHRLYSGGPSLVRGWVDRGILPPGTDWEPGTPRLGGNAAFQATVEPRLHVHPHATLTAFLDAASVWEQVADARLDTLRWSTGFGIRFPLIIGEGHLIFAWVVGNPQQELDPGRFRIHLTLDPY